MPFVLIFATGQWPFSLNKKHGFPLQLVSFAVHNKFSVCIEIIIAICMSIMIFTYCQDIISMSFYHNHLFHVSF